MLVCDCGSQELALLPQSLPQEFCSWLKCMLIHLHSIERCIMIYLNVSVITERDATEHEPKQKKKTQKQERKEEGKEIEDNRDQCF